MGAPSVVTEHCGTKAETGAGEGGDGRGTVGALERWRRASDGTRDTEENVTRGGEGGNARENNRRKGRRKLKEALGGRTGGGKGKRAFAGD